MGRFGHVDTPRQKWVEWNDALSMTNDAWRWRDEVSIVLNIVPRKPSPSAQPDPDRTKLDKAGRGARYEGSVG